MEQSIRGPLSECRTQACVKAIEALALSLNSEDVSHGGQKAQDYQTSPPSLSP